MSSESRQSPSAEQAHEHEWSNGPVMERVRVSASPCSTMDDHLWTDVIQVQTCSCGSTRRLLLGYKDRRRRGDDMRRAAGRHPLGTPLTPSDTYRVPKVLP